MADERILNISDVVVAILGKTANSVPLSSIGDADFEILRKRIGVLIATVYEAHALPAHYIKFGSDI